MIKGLDVSYNVVKAIRGTTVFNIVLSLSPNDMCPEHSFPSQSLNEIQVVDESCNYNLQQLKVQVLICNISEDTY